MTAITQAQQARLIDEMLMAFHQESLDREISDGWTLRQELHLLFFDTMKGKGLDTAGPVELLAEMSTLLKAEMIALGIESLDGWPE